MRRRPPRNGAPNSNWAIDLTGKQDAGAQQHDILGLIDHGTRRLLMLQPVPAATYWALPGHLCRAIARFCQPRSLRTDNALVFRSRLFRTGMAVLGIRHRPSAVGGPWQNGRIERLFEIGDTK